MSARRREGGPGSHNIITLFSTIWFYRYILLLVVGIRSGASARNICDSIGESYPRHYTVHRLLEGKTIELDGKLDDRAWEETPWSEPFVDIEGDQLKPSPRFETKMKMRWDDQCLYVGAYLEEPQAWANLTLNNSIVYHDNDFEVFVDPDGSTQYYKELELNAYNTQWNLLMVKPYLNGGPAVCNATVKGQCSMSDPQHGVDSYDISPYLHSGVYIEGALNDPAIGSKWWSVELCIPLEQYTQYEDVALPPKDGDYWRINFSRVQYQVTTVVNTDGAQVYWKDESSPPDNWVWQPTGVINIHLPERWGILQFTTSTDTSEGPSVTKRDPLWVTRKALAEVYQAQKAYDALYGKTLGYATSIDSLVLNANLPQWVASGLCTGKPQLTLTPTGGFVVTIAVPEQEGLVGSITDDREIRFVHKEDDGRGDSSHATTRKRRLRID